MPAIVKGSARWHETEWGQLPVLEIKSRVVGSGRTTTKLYAVNEVFAGAELYPLDSTRVYTVNTVLGTCDCPDAKNNPRPGGCKHVWAVRAALPTIPK